jgi:hypothetical protein
MTSTLFLQNMLTINHLFIQFTFTKLVWERIKTIQKIKKKWEGITLSYCFTSLTEEKVVSSILIALTCWFIWIERNKEIFKNASPLVLSVIIKTLGSLNSHPTTQKCIPLRSCLITHHVGFSISCFDGVAHSGGKHCGAGGVIKTPISQFIDGFSTAGKEPIQRHNFWEFGKLSHWLHICPFKKFRHWETQR